MKFKCIDEIEKILEKEIERRLRGMASEWLTEATMGEDWDDSYIRNFLKIEKKKNKSIPSIILFLFWSLVKSGDIKIGIQSVPKGYLPGKYTKIKPSCTDQNKTYYSSDLNLEMDFSFDLEIKTRV